MPSTPAADSTHATLVFLLDCADAWVSVRGAQRYLEGKGQAFPFLIQPGPAVLGGKSWYVPGVVGTVRRALRRDADEVCNELTVTAAAGSVHAVRVDMPGWLGRERLTLLAATGPELDTVLSAYRLAPAVRLDPEAPDDLAVMARDLEKKLGADPTEGVTARGARPRGRARTTPRGSGPGRIPGRRR